MNGAPAWWATPRPDAWATRRIPAADDVLFTTNPADQRCECAETEALYETYQRSLDGEGDSSGGLPQYKRRPLGLARRGGRMPFECVTLCVRVGFPQLRRRGPG
jgi:hypothetical protein